MERPAIDEFLELRPRPSDFAVIRNQTKRAAVMCRETAHSRNWVVFRLEQKTIEFLGKDYERPQGGPQSEDPGEHGIYAAKWIERQIVHHGRNSYEL